MLLLPVSYMLLLSLCFNVYARDARVLGLTHFLLHDSKSLLFTCEYKHFITDLFCDIAMQCAISTNSALIRVNVYLIPHSSVYMTMMHGWTNHIPWLSSIDLPFSVNITNLKGVYKSGKDYLGSLKS